MARQEQTTQPVGGMQMAHYSANSGGLNVTDSPLSVADGQATGGFNYEYVKTGGVKKSRAPTVINSSPDSQLRSRGFNLHNTKAGVRTLIRMANTGFETVDVSTGAISVLTDDTVSATSALFTSASTKLAFSHMFTTPSTDILWTVGGGLALPYGAYSTTKVTQNGTPTSTGSITAVRGAAGGGSWAATGTYFWSVAYRKAGTQALSNAGLDVTATVVAGTDKVTINLTGLTNLDTTKYDKIYLYRSVVSGVTEFTAGSLVAQITSSTTTYDDLGTSLTTSTNVPRAGGAVLDNSVLPSGTYDSLAVWKRRLVTASESTVYFSDLNKPESWPTANSFNIPSGGKITGLVAVGYNHPGGTDIDEFLIVFKESECWAITGTSSTDWALNFLDYTGCVQQGLACSANGAIYWIDRRGVYIWDGAGKPVYVSRPIEFLFSVNGNIDKALLNLGTCDFFRDQNQVIWYLSSTTLGEQLYVLKLDLRLTLPLLKNLLGERIIEGVFLQGKTSSPVYACRAVQSPVATENRDFLIIGDNAGYVYRAFNASAGSGNDIAFSYLTAHLDQGRMGVTKRYNKVIAWIDADGDWTVNLDYWTNYRVRDSEKSTITTTIGSSAAGASSFWDMGFWDVAIWDEIQPTLIPVVFNLPPGASQNNNEGDAIRLQFSNSTTNQPVAVNAFTLLYTELGVRK